YIKVVKRPYPPLLLTFIIYGQVIPQYFEHYVPGWKALESLAIVGGEDIYYVKSELKITGDKMFEAFQDPAVFKKSIAKFEANEKVLLDSVNTTYEEFIDAYERYTPALQVLTVQGLIKDTLEQRLKEKTSEEEALGLMDTLNIPLRDNEYKIEMRELAETDDLESHVAKYKYVGARYGSREGYTIEQARQKKTNLDTGQMREESKHEKVKIIESIARAKELLETVDENLVDVMQWIVYYRTQRTDILNRSSFDAYDLFESKAQELGLTYSELILCTRDEVAQKNIPSKDILDQRKKQYSIINVKKDIRIYHGQDNKNIIEFFQEDLSGITSVTGQVASKGIVQGVVRNIGTIHDLDKLQDGEILVTSMTTPDMVSAMGRAIAFITDEGGITCHAAIMSRELKKPCIIGTEIATKIFNDGDLVEVDADNGIVRILEKNKQSRVFKKYLDHKGNEDVLVVRGRFSPLFVTTWILGDGSLALYYGFKKDKALITGRLDLYQGLAFDTFKNYLTNKFDLNIFKQKYNSYEKIISQLYELHINADLSNYSENDLIEAITSIQNVYDEMIVGTLFIEFLEAGTVKAVLKKVENNIDSLDGILEYISSTPFNSFEKRFENAKIALAQKEISKEIINNGKYLYTDYYSTQEGDFIKEDLLTYSNKDIKEVAYKDKEFVLNLNTKELKIYEYIKYVTHLRDYRKDNIAKCQALLQILSEEMIDRSSLAKQDALYVLPTELIKGIVWIRENKKSIQSRINGFETFTHGRDVIEVANNENIDLEKIEKELASHDTDAESISGEGASKGLVRGTVRIILDAQNKDNIFNNGDILVTSMTRPEFVPLMKQAGAIVTNEGGITCHAAIISRELNIPCVIGTKFATQIIKDGDLVEVDADNGIVRILEKKDSQVIKISV
ncbi:MAG: phosphohistidine swiveling domain-containing protein, partial [Flavobacteriaceae bacterium]